VVKPFYEQGFDPRLVPEKLAEPLKWPTQKTIFVNSMSDLFHEDVPDWYVEQVVRVMQLANWHTYQVLTKRAARLRDLLSSKLSFAERLDHIWWGVSVEDRKHGVPRIAQLRDAPARIRFLSIEPLLEDVGEIDLSGIHWVIVGGESGAGARSMELAWVLAIKNQCRARGIPFFFKQWGGLHKSKNGRILEGCTFDEMPARCTNRIPSRNERLAMIEGVNRSNLAMA